MGKGVAFKIIPMILLCVFVFFSRWRDMYHSIPVSQGFSDGSDGKESSCNVRDWVQSLGREDPLEKEMATPSSILAWRTP